MTNPYGPPPGNQPYPQQGPVPPGPYGPPSGPQPMQQPPMQQGMPAHGGYPQPGMQPPAPMPQPMAPPAPGMGRVLIDCSFFWLGFMLTFFKPQVTINGQPGPILSWGKTPVDLPPGQHQIQIHVNYLWKIGHATAVIPVNVGQQVDVYYAAPMIVFMGGAIGPVPQKSPGLGLTLGLVGASFGLAILMVLISVISAL